MEKNFQACLDFVLHFEGAYSDHPLDPGGATNLGITLADLSQWRLPMKTSKADVKALTVADVVPIYRTKYWHRVRCDELPTGLDLAMFDCAVNQGVQRAVRYLQTVLGVTVDGHFGPKTLAAVAGIPLDALIVEFSARRMLGYGNLQALFKTFGLGWSRRLMACQLSATLLWANDARIFETNRTIATT